MSDAKRSDKGAMPTVSSVSTDSHEGHGIEAHTASTGRHFHAVKLSIKAGCLAKQVSIPLLHSRARCDLSRQGLIRMYILLVIPLILSLIVMTICTTHAHQNVTAFHIRAKQDAPLHIGGSGVIYPKQQIPISYAAAGRVTNVIVHVGDAIEANQPLIQLDQTQVKTQIDLAQNDVAAAQQYLDSVSSAAPYNPITIANAQQRLQLAQNKYHALISQSASQLHDSYLVAPANGVVSAINVTPGQNFAARAVLLTLIDPSSVTVHAQISLESLNQIRKGMTAIVNPSAFPNLNLQGKVTTIEPQANPQTSTFEAKILLANPQQTLLPGMSAFVRIESQTHAYVVPRLAVLNQDREPAVFKIRNNHAYITQVHIIGRSDNAVYIDQGVAANDQIVLLPLDLIHEGEYVNIVHQE
jgi:RND family efflux transporter MFP subunit